MIINPYKKKGYKICLYLIRSIKMIKLIQMIINQERKKYALYLQIFNNKKIKIKIKTFKYNNYYKNIKIIHFLNRINKMSN